MKIGKKARNALLTAGIVVLAAPLAAVSEETESEEAVSLAPVVVTATRSAKEVGSAPGSVSVVTQEELEQRNVQTLEQALAPVSGVYANTMGKGLLSTMSSVTMRGMSSDKRVLFLLDGVAPLNDAYSGGVGYQFQSVEDIRQIEVVKGPFSSLYGGNAMGGVVNILTKMPEKQEATVKAGYGSSWDRGEALDDLEKLYLSYGDKVFDKLSLFGSFGHKTTNGYAAGQNVQSANPATAGLSGALPTTSTTGAPRYRIGDSGDNTWADNQLTLKTACALTSATKADLSFRHATLDWGYDSTHTYLRNTAGNPAWSYGTVRESSFLSGDGGKEQNIATGSLETRWGSVIGKLGAGYVDVTDSWGITKGTTATRSGGPGSVSETPSSTLNTDLQLTLPLGTRQLLTTGGGYRSEEAASREYGLTNWHNRDSKTGLTYESEGQAHTYALFAQDEIHILDALTGYLGLREDWWQGEGGHVFVPGAGGPTLNYDGRGDSALSPKAALVAKPLAATTLRLSAGKAFRAPTTYDLYRTWTSNSGITYVSNPNLTPETVTSWDAGIEQGLWQGMTIKATYFDNQMDELIYTRTVSATRQEKINAGKASSRGVELEAEQRFAFGLRFFANATFTSSEVEENAASPASVGKELTQTPSQMYAAGATLERGPLTASLLGRHLSKRYGNDTNTDVVDGVYTSYDPCTLVDTKIAYKIDQHTEISFAVDNLFNEEYFAYYQGVGRSFFTELTWRF